MTLSDAKIGCAVLSRIGVTVADATGAVDKFRRMGKGETTTDNINTAELEREVHIHYTGYDAIIEVSTGTLSQNDLPSWIVVGDEFMWAYALDGTQLQVKRFGTMR